MVQPTPMPPRDDDRLSPGRQIELEALRETTEVQQRTIRFLLTNWDAMVAQAALGFGKPITLNLNDKIPAGTWLCTNPATGNIATMTIATTTPPTVITITAPGPFVSDGTAVVTATTPLTLVPVMGV